MTQVTTSLIGELLHSPLPPLADNLTARLTQVLQEGGVHAPQDVELVVEFFTRLHEGWYQPEIWLRLSGSSLQFGAKMLLCWLDTQRPFSRDGGAQLEQLALRLINDQQSLILPRLQQSQHPHIDPPTGLLTSSILPRLLHQHLARPSLALLHLDFGGSFRACSDTLLLSAAERLKSMLRPQDTLILIDRHTLGLVLPELSGREHALLAAHRARTLLSDGLALDIGGLNVRLHPQIGIALAPEHASDALNLLSAAAQAAHEHAQDGIGVYDPDRDWLGQLIARLDLPLREALRNNQLDIAFQPQVCSRTRQLHGMEALLRWHSHALGQVPPGQIMRVAEQLGLMSSITHWIINAALRQYKPLLRQGIPGTLSINLAPSNLRDSELPALIANACSIWGVPGERLVFEITESAVIDDIDSALGVLHALREQGCRLALDDFGTGFSSLTYLKRLPIDEVKIDRSFVIAMSESQRDYDIVESVITLAHKLGLEVVAEGVEDRATLQRLRDIECDVIQGFFYSRAIPAGDIPAFVQQLTAGTMHA